MATSFWVGMRHDIKEDPTLNIYFTPTQQLRFHYLLMHLNEHGQMAGDERVLCEEERVTAYELGRCSIRAWRTMREKLILHGIACWDERSNTLVILDWWKWVNRDKGATAAASKAAAARADIPPPLPRRPTPKSDEISGDSAGFADEFGADSRSKREESGDIIEQNKIEYSNNRTNAPDSVESPFDSAQTDPVALVPSASAAAFSDLVSELVQCNVNESDAVRLARDKPSQCRRQLDLLPYKTPPPQNVGAYLRSAIEDGYAPPPAYLAKQREQAEAEKLRERTARQREQQQQNHDRDAANQQILCEWKEKMQRDDPDLWRMTYQNALKQVPPPIQAMIEKRGTAPYQGMIDRKLWEIMQSQGQMQSREPALRE